MGLPKAPKVEGRVMLEDKEAELFVARASVGACHPQRSETAVLRCTQDVCAQVFVARKTPRRER